MTYDDLPNPNNVTPSLELSPDELSLLFDHVASKLTTMPNATLEPAKGVYPVSADAEVPYSFSVDVSASTVQGVFHQNDSTIIVNKATLSYMQPHSLEPNETDTASTVSLIIESSIGNGVTLNEYFQIYMLDGVLSADVEEEYEDHSGQRISPNDIPKGQGVSTSEDVQRVLGDLIKHPLTLDEAQKLRELVDKIS